MGGTQSNTGELTAAAPSSRQSLWKPIMLGVLLIAFMVLARVLHVGDRLGELREWILSLGALGPVAYIIIYIAAVIFAVPGSVITIMGGLLFGSLVGVLSVSVGSTIGAGLAFLIARYMARDSIAGRLADNAKFQKLDRMTEEHGTIIVAITRLVPLFPFNLLNYGFGLTRVPFRTYLLWSWICMLPGTVLYVVGTDAVASTLSEGRVPIGLIAVLVVMVGLITVLVAQARKKLKSGEETISDG
jgi:uncharacterized membrane protein YdjX (TVP38/TMEM64 family)